MRRYILHLETTYYGLVGSCVVKLLEGFDLAQLLQVGSQ
jgi:hypothetical protein